MCERANSDNVVRQRTVYLMCHGGSKIGVDNYVGSTSKKLSGRLSRHKYRARNYVARGYNNDNKLYSRMNAVGIDRWVMRPLLTLECTRSAIREFEKMWCSILNADLNTNSREICCRCTEIALAVE